MGELDCWLEIKLININKMKAISQETFNRLVKTKEWKRNEYVAFITWDRLDFSVEGGTPELAKLKLFKEINNK